MGCGSSTSQDGKAYAANKAVFDQFMAAWINKDTTASQLAGYIHEECRVLAGASNGGDQRCRWMNTFKKGPNGFRAFADALALPTFMTGLSYSVAMGDPAEDLEVKLTYTPSHLGKTGPSVTDTIAVVFLRGLIRCVKWTRFGDAKAVAQLYEGSAAGPEATEASKPAATKAADMSEEQAATKIQAGFRGLQARRSVDEKKMDNELNAYKDEQEARLQEQAATKIQAGFRGFKAREEVFEKRESEQAATTIQAGFRGHMARKELKEKKAPAYVITFMTVTGPGFGDYVAGLPGTLAPLGGKLVMRGYPGGKPGPCLYTNSDAELFTVAVVIEFPSYAAADEWHHSEAYQAILPKRVDNSTGPLVIAGSTGAALAGGAQAFLAGFIQPKDPLVTTYPARAALSPADIANLQSQLEASLGAAGGQGSLLVCSPTAACGFAEHDTAERYAAVVLAAFPTGEAASAWYKSPECTKLLATLGEHGTGPVVVAELK